MKAMIFAAGLGTRLKPLTDTMPKALVPVGGRPLLQILIDKLTAAGFTDLVINVHHFADMIEATLTPALSLKGEGDLSSQSPLISSKTDYNTPSPFRERAGVRVSFSDERAQLLETGGGIRHAAPLLQDADRFLIHNVDILSNVDLQAFWQAGSEAEATLLVSERETQRYLLFDDDLRLVGWTNTKTGEVKSPYPDLDPSRCRKLAFAGIHQMHTSLLPLMADYPAKFSIIDFYLAHCARHTIRGYIQPSLRLMDVGKLDTLSAADQFLASL